MKVMLFTVAASLVLSFSPMAQADDFAVTSPALRLDGNNVNLNFNIAGIPAAQRDVKIMFCGVCQGGRFTETTEIQNGNDWYSSTGNNKSTVKEMVQAGWFIQSVFNLNATQMYVVFIK
ncbi:MAG: hypothetical protein RIR39_556 [Pseudomonadota bacterium]